MKVFTDETIIAKKKKQANIVTPVAMVALVGGLIANFQSASGGIYILITFTLLAIGVIAASISAHLVNHWVREPRTDQILTRILKGSDKRHLLFNYTSPAPHVLITNNKIYAITPKIVDGEISVKERKWRRKFKISRLLRFFGEEGLGNPTTEAEHNHKRLSELIRSHVTDDGLDIEPLVLFTNPNVELSIEEPTLPILSTNELKRFIRQETKGPAFKPETRDQLIEILKPVTSETT